MGSGAAPGPPPQSRPGLRLRAGPGAPRSRVLRPRSGASWGPSPETSSSPSCCSQVPPQPLACPRPSRPPPSAASPFRRKAPLSAAGRVESALGPGRFRQWGWTAISALGPFRRRCLPRPATLPPELAGLGRASRGAPWGSEFANFRGAGGRSARVGAPLALRADASGGRPRSLPALYGGRAHGRREQPGRRRRGNFPLPNAGPRAGEGAAPGKTSSGPTAPRVGPPCLF